MFLTDCVYQLFPDVDPHRVVYDQTGKLWSKAWLSLTNSYPSISGYDVGTLLQLEANDHDDTKNKKEEEQKKEKNVVGTEEKPRACLFVANHASWLDIPVLCTVLDPVFKFIAKGELSNVPCIGQQLKGVSRW
jgi:1-acyl-sn-glycerol-3-phosphate acyltransferase